jgi:hypothetical protein
MRVRNLVQIQKIGLQSLTVAFSSFARPPVEHARLAHSTLWICQLVGIAMPLVCADVDVSCPRCTPRSLDALPGVNTGTVVASCSCLGSPALDVGLGGHFACGVCHRVRGLHHVHCDDCELFSNPISESSNREYM